LIRHVSRRLNEVLVSYMTVENTTALVAPDLPVDPEAFWGDVPADLVVDDTTARAELPVLDQLGAAPFKKPEKGGFPFLGFLASVYEHVSSTASSEMHSGGNLIGPI
jgi:hypothetical protein